MNLPSSGEALGTLFAGATFEFALAVLGLARVEVNGRALPVELLGHWTRFDYAQWFMRALGGIRVAADAVAANRVIVDPCFSSATDAVSCSYQTPHGRIEVRWQRTAAEVEVSIAAPAGVDVDTAALDAHEGVSVIREA